MDPAEFDKMAEVEESNWWFRGRRRMVNSWVARRHAERGPLRMLDVGCATGISLQSLGEFGEVRGLDISEETIRLCRARGEERIVRGDAQALPFRDQSFDVVLALDALEHLPDDAAAIREIRRVARPDALILVTVPAFMFLWSPHDDAYHHLRRYTRPELQSRLTAGGLRIRKLSYHSMCVMPPVYLLRRYKAWRGGESGAQSDFFLPLPGPVESLLYGIMRTEAALMRLASLPFGVSLFAACEPA